MRNEKLTEGEEAERGEEDEEESGELMGPSDVCGRQGVCRNLGTFGPFGAYITTVVKYVQAPSDCKVERLKMNQN